MTDFEKKYIKYKTKYLVEKNQIEKQNCSLGDFWYGNNELQEDIDYLINNKRDEDKNLISNYQEKNIRSIKDKYQILSHIKLMFKTVTFIINLDFKLGSLPKIVTDFTDKNKYIKNNKILNDNFSDLNKRLIYVLNILSEIDIYLELYFRFLKIVEKYYLTKENSGVYKLFYLKAKKSYDTILQQLYNDLGFDFKENEIYNIDLFFNREHPNKLQTIFDKSFNKVLKTKNKEDRIAKYCMEKIYFIFMNIDSIYNKMMPHLNSIENSISRLELLIDITNCNFKTETFEYQKPMKKLIFKLFEVIQEDKSLKEEILKESRILRISNNIKKGIEKALITFDI